MSGGVHAAQPGTGELERSLPITNAGPRRRRACGGCDGTAPVGDDELVSYAMANPVPNLSVGVTPPATIAAVRRRRER